METPASDDEAASEVLSHYSSASESTSVVEEVPGGEAVDEQAQQEDVEDKLKEYIDNVMDKSAKIRQVALENLRLAFSSKMLFDFLLERRLTVTDSLEKCLKKGKGEEQSLAATVLTLLCLQMGSGPEGEEVFRSLKPLLVTILTDASASPVARQSCATALGMCCYIAAADMEDLVSCLGCLEGIFGPSCSNDTSLVPSHHSPLLQTLHCNALQSWSLLLTICPGTQIKKILDNHLPKLPLMLSSDNVNLRIVAGETIALLFELARDMEEDFYYEDTDLLCTKLKALATDSNKYRAKTDRRKQRSIFRDVLHFIENGECHEETIKFGLECMYVDSWARRRTYNAFKEALGSGVRHHLQNNELLREIFELGPPLVLDPAAIKASKISRFEKHLYNSAAFKARTKARSRVRDKRADIL
ncbi:interferon-related developmental regulator 2 isoform X2 [Varanus komodoensis]|uniref:Interferon related developmental regulator 2 n=2 Tax=Varanus komodoensis TaxID=61221 RepID=A0A8D2LFN9_VARKO|nr:interferon-related developmental regulator 2 isoform X2 [Varanus komodoensis]XP_044307029.1 interferon-related developmental regulator 2 isoform X2 [Varanus komodoensis]